MLSKKSISAVLIEAVVVGICLILFGNLIAYFKNYIFPSYYNNLD